MPKQYFTDLIVEQEGTSAGTVAQVHVNVMSARQVFHVEISEPDPGRVIDELLNYNLPFPESLEQ